MSNALIYHSRASAEADWECQRARYYQYELEGGIVKDNLTLELFIGNVVHDGVAGIAHQHNTLGGQVDIDQIASDSGKLVKDTLLDYYSGGTNELAQDNPNHLVMMEQSTLVEALLRGFYKTTWPNIIAQYPIVFGSEYPTIYPHDAEGKLSLKGPFVYKAKPDLILGVDEDTLIYYELKTTSNKKVEWINSWNNSMQVHGTAKAMEFITKKEILGTIVQGFYKGYTSYGKYSCPLVYGYVGTNKGNPPFTKPSTYYSTEYIKGGKRVGVWEIPGGPKFWIDKLSIEELSEQFPKTPLIFTKDDIAQDFFYQRGIRESGVLTVNQRLQAEDTSDAEKRYLMAKHFPQSFSKCTPSFGHHCNYVNICHGPAKSDPIGSGLFCKRDREHNDVYRELVKELEIGQ